MKLNMILEAASKTFASIKMGGRRDDPKLAALDRGILTVALMLAALDGTILPEEYAAFELLARKCRGGSAKNVRTLLDSVLADAGRLMAMAQVGVYSEKERLSAFLDAATKALPVGFVCGSMADVRRAFALWVSLGVSDGEFSKVEKSAVEALDGLFAAVRTNRPVRLLESDFLAKAERIVRDLATPSKRAKAEASLAELVSCVPARDASGTPVLRPSVEMSVRLTSMSPSPFGFPV